MNHIKKILGYACIILGCHGLWWAEKVSYQFNLAQWGGPIAVTIVGLELVLIRHHIHKK